MRVAVVSEQARGVGGLGGLFVARSESIEPASRRHVLRYHIEGHEALEAASAKAGLPHAFRPISPEAPDIHLKGIVMPRMAVWNISSATGFKSIPNDVPDVYTIRIPLERSVLSRTLACEHETPAGSATILPAIDGVATRFAPGARVLNCAVGVRDLVAHYRSLEGCEAPLFRFQPMVKLQGPRLHALAHTIGQIGDHAGTAADMLTGPLLVDLLLNQILSAWPRVHHDHSETWSRVATRAVDYIEAHLAEPLTVGDIASASAVSVRTLQSAFREFMGRAPVAYILDRRLECAHADLVANEGRLQVSQIAYRWGFLHMGEFARRYRLRYGCPPSQTGRRTQ